MYVCMYVCILFRHAFIRTSCSSMSSIRLGAPGSTKTLDDGALWWQSVRAVSYTALFALDLVQVCYHRAVVLQPIRKVLRKIYIHRRKINVLPITRAKALYLPNQYLALFSYLSAYLLHTVFTYIHTYIQVFRPDYRALHRRSADSATLPRRILSCPCQSYPLLSPYIHTYIHTHLHNITNM